MRSLLNAGALKLALSLNYPAHQYHSSSFMLYSGSCSMRSVKGSFTSTCTAASMLLSMPHSALSTRLPGCPWAILSAVRIRSRAKSLRLATQAAEFPAWACACQAGGCQKGRQTAEKDLLEGSAGGLSGQGMGQGHNATWHNGTGGPMPSPICPPPMCPPYVPPICPLIACSRASMSPSAMAVRPPSSHRA